MKDKSIAIRIKGREQFLKIGKTYFFELRDDCEIPIHMLRSEVKDIYWNDIDSGKSFFYIYVLEHNKDYLICDDNIYSAKLADLEVGKFYNFLMENGYSIIGEFLEHKEIGQAIQSLWVDIGRQPVYLDYKDIAEIIELDIQSL